MAHFEGYLAVCYKLEQKLACYKASLSFQIQYARLILGSRHGMSGGAVGFQTKTRIGLDNPSSPMGPLLCTQCDPNQDFLHLNSEGSDQTGLSWIFRLSGSLCLFCRVVAYR